MPITSVKLNKYVRYYNQSENSEEKNISNYYGYNPLKLNNKAPFVHHPIKETLLPHNKNRKTKVLLKGLQYSERLLSKDKPVVLVFRPFIYNDIEVQCLFLESLQADIQVMGGELIIVTNATVRQLTANTSRPNSLHIFSDLKNKIAELYGLYNIENPVSDWLSGIEGDISLPAYYIINPDGKIVYHYIDYNFRTYDYEGFSEQPFFRQLLSNVYKHAQKLKQLLN